MVLFILALGSFVRPVWPADDLMASQLVDQARQWQQKNRDDIAAEIWRKVLRTDPSQGEALVELGLIEARANRREEARALLERANRIRPKANKLDRLAAALARENAGDDKAVPPQKPERAKSGAPVTVYKQKTAPINQSQAGPDTPRNALILKLSTSLDQLP